ncbi:MAG: hypothetical protein ACLGPL_06330 [Acidobacteriota bacterium]
MRNNRALCFLIAALCAALWTFPARAFAQGGDQQNDLRELQEQWKQLMKQEYNPATRPLSGKTPSFSSSGGSDGDSGRASHKRSARGHHYRSSKKYSRHGHHQTIARHSGKRSIRSSGLKPHKPVTYKTASHSGKSVKAKAVVSKPTVTKHVVKEKSVAVKHVAKGKSSDKPQNVAMNGRKPAKR